jgi:NTP pyrophosphatase (non-canonical NTP hydrolase)
MTQEEIYKEAIATYGVESQRKMAIEEMSELTNALMKFDRGRNTVEDIVEEIADVIIMMNQLSIIYGQKAVQQQIDFKTQRLRKRLAKNGN